MRSISQSCLFVIAVALAFCFSARLAYADGESVSGCSNCNGYSFTASIAPVSGSTYQVTYTITNNSGVAATPYNWSLTAFDHGDSISSPSGLTATGSNGADYSSAFQVLAGKSNNGNANCNGTISYAICVQQSRTGKLPVLGTGTGQFKSLTFTFDINCSGCGLMSSWDFLSSGNPPNNGRGNVYAISNWGTPNSVPEPSVLLLYTSTLAVGLVFAWRTHARRRSTRT